MAELGLAPSVTWEKRLVPIGLILYFLVSVTVAVTSSGTYDAGDSVMHFQIARYAFQHPDNLLSHWGKPFFTLVAAPFAALGFWGMKLFQCLLAFGMGWLTWQNARLLRLKGAWLAPILVLAAPEFFLSQLSGLTEPFFAFMLTLGVFLLLRGNDIWGAIAFSLLPFVRTEGFLILPVVGVYLMLRREWKAVPFLAFGTVVYAVLGGIFLGDFLWIWTKNPYANKTQSYGIGELLHFPKQYLFIVGIPIYVLTILGLVMAPVRLAVRSVFRPMEEIFLVLGPFAVYFIAHVYFWVSGVGHSMGLIRVMIGIVPLGAIFALGGLGQVVDWVPGRLGKLKMGILGVLTAYIMAFPLIPNPAALHANEFKMTVDQRLLQEAGEWMQNNGLLARKLYTVHPSAAYYLGLDPFNPERYRSLNRYRDDQPSAGCLILLDTWFGKVESGYSPEFFDTQPGQFRRLQAWTGQEGNTAIGLYLYEKI